MIEALNDVGSMRCQLCKSTIKEFNDIEKMANKKIDENALEYGFSVLHSYIRFMEGALHVSYRKKMAEEFDIKNSVTNLPKWSVCTF